MLGKGVEIVACVESGDAKCLIEHYRRLLLSYDRWSKIHAYLRTIVKPYPWDIHFDEEFDVLKDPVLGPMRKNDYQKIMDSVVDTPIYEASVIKQMYASVASRQLDNCGLMKMRNECVLLLCLTPKKLDSTLEIMWGSMLYYLDETERNGFDEPLFEVLSDSELRHANWDLDASKRLVTIMYSILWYLNGVLRGSEQLILEVMFHYLKNGQKGMSILKDNVAPTLFGAFTGSTSGSGVSWTNTDYGVIEPTLYSVDEVTNLDRVVLVIQRKYYLEKIKNLREGGLIKLADKLEYLLTAEVNLRNLQDVGALFLMEGMNGYFRSNIYVTHEKQLEQVTHATPEGERILYERVKNKWYSIFNSTNPDEMTVDSWYNALPSAMTGRSAGVKKEKRSVKVNLNLRSGRRVREFKLASNTKNFVFLANPNKYLTYQAFSESLTADNPGTTGTRDVPARKSRMINVVPLPFYCVEMLLFKAIYAVAIALPEYYFGEASGSAVGDNNYVLTNMSRGGFWIAADIDALDVHLRYNNMRRGFHEAALRFMSEHEVFQQKMGPNYTKNGKQLTMAELVNEMIEKTRSAHYRLPNGKVVSIESVGSGEKGTAVYDSVGTEQMIMEVMFYLQQLMGVTVLKRTFLGDDSLLHCVMDKWDVNNVGRMYDTFETEPRNMGLNINRVKTVIRVFMTEYLKVPIIHGYICPRITNLQLLGGETATGAFSAIERSRAMLSQLSTWVSRGGDHTFAKAYMYMFFLIVGRVKRAAQQSDGSYVNQSGEKAFYNLDIWTLFVPKFMGGVGMLYRSIYMPNCDLFVWTYPDSILYKIKEASAGLQFKSTIKRDISRAMARSPDMYGVEYMRERLNGAIAAEAARAMNRLKKVPDKNYFTIPEHIVMQAIEGKKEVRWLAEMENELMIDSVGKRKIPENLWDKMKKVWDMIEIEMTDELIEPVWSVCPIAGCEIFTRFRHLYWRNKVAPRSVRMESRIRTMMARADFHSIYLPSEIIAAITKSEGTDDAMDRLRILGFPPDKEAVVYEIITFIQHNMSDIDFLMDSERFSISDNILGEFRLDNEDYKRLVEEAYTDPLISLKTLGLLQSVVTVYASIIVPIFFDGRVFKLRVKFNSRD